MFKTVIALALVCSLTDARQFNMLAELDQQNLNQHKGFEMGTKAAK